MFDLERRALNPALHTIRRTWPLLDDVDSDRPERESISDSLKEDDIHKGGSFRRSSSTASSREEDVPSRRQPTAQLTMFYAGTVNVYDDVPADKAHAIMRLASGYESWSSHFVSAPSVRVSSPEDAKAALLALNLAVTIPATGVETGVSFNTPLSSSSAPLPAFSDCMKQGLVLRRDEELPVARKASLVRFLKKRKERFA